MYKILICSDSPFVESGYGVQCYNLMLGFLEMGHEIFFIPANMCNIKNNNQYYLLKNIKSYIEIPKSDYYNKILKYEDKINWIPNNKSDMGISSMFKFLETNKVNFIIFLKDIWLIPRDLKFPDNFVLWLPIDHEPMCDKLWDIIKNIPNIVTLSEYGQKELMSRGKKNEYIYHSIVHQKTKFEESKYKDYFICSMVCANNDTPSRKCIELNLQAFSEFKKKYVNTILLLKTNMNGTTFFNTKYGIDIKTIIDKLNLKNDIIIIDKKINTENIINIYKRSHVLLHASAGEGFGVPIIEAQLYGCPVITTSTTAMPELTINGISVVDTNTMFVSYDMMRQIPSVKSILEAMEMIYKRTCTQKKYFNKIGKNYIKENFNYKKIAKKWIDYFKNNINN